MTRRSTDLREATEATATPKPLPPKPTSLPHAKELVSLQIDHHVLDYFQEHAPGWQERIKQALRNAAGK